MLPEEAKDSADAAGLRYVSDAMPGIRRLRRGRAFTYRGSDGRSVADAATIARIRSLAVPPAWDDVWICSIPHGHLQATGRDARGRKQYRYHPRWREVRDEAKFSRLADFGSALPRIRRRVSRDLAKPGLPREKVLAGIVSLLDQTGLRIGNEEYARANDSYGLTTLRNTHALVESGRITFRFRGKSGRRTSVQVTDRRLARVVKACRDIPGQELFQYLDDSDQAVVVDSGDVNEYLGELTGRDFTSKDFRTWIGTVQAAVALRDMGEWGTKEQARRNVLDAIEHVASELGNTAAVARKCYVHPDVVACYEDGRLLSSSRPGGPARAAAKGLTADEAWVCRLLRSAARARGRRAA